MTPALDAAARAQGEDIPLAMQIALRIEKSTPPTDIEVCEAAARACVGLLAQAELRAEQGETEWVDAVNAWRGIAIRKIVRRCRGKRWDDAQELPGVTAQAGQGEARAFVPAPAWPLPPQLAKMQVEGTELEPGTPGAGYVTVRLSPLVDMTSGKSAAQCAHAAQRAYEAMSLAQRSAWAQEGFSVCVIRDTKEHWDKTPGRISIVDAGFTELDGQHETTRADW